MAATVYLIPTVLSDGATACLPSTVLHAIKNCCIFFVENERTARRHFKALWKEMVIDDYEWHSMKTITPQVEAAFANAVKKQQNIGIVSEAGCPGVADPGQQLVAMAQKLNATVRPMVGPNAILLALMASGMNGQHFQFLGYLPVDATEKIKTIRQLEAESNQRNCTQIFIETPYRNNQLLEALVKTCKPATQLCVAVNLTAANESVQTKTVAQWKQQLPQLHKMPAIFLLYAQQ